MNQLPPEIGGYRLGNLLAKGGMGAVYRAVSRDGQHAAFKTCLRVSRRAVQRMHREVNALQRVQHPHVVRLLDAGPGPPPWLAMELIDGETLTQRARHAPLGLDDTLRALEELADALSALHRLGIVHRDLKPENVMLRRGSGSAVLCDFGINRGDDDESLTRTGAMIGTFDFMAPEQGLGERVGPPADVWGLGAILYWAINGQPPNVSSLRPLELSHAPRELQRAVQALCDRCLDETPDARPTASELRAQLAGLRAARGGASTRRLPRLLLATVALAFVTAGAWFLRSGPAAESTALATPQPLDPQADARPFELVWSLEAGSLEPSDPRQWTAPAVVDPFAVPRVSFAGPGELEVLESGRLRITYPLARLPVRPRHPERFRARVGDAPPVWTQGADGAELATPFSSGGALCPLGSVHWGDASLRLRAQGDVDEAGNAGILWVGMTPGEWSTGLRLRVQTTGPRHLVQPSDAWVPCEQGHGRIRLTPARSPWATVADTPYPPPTEETPTAGRFAVWVEVGRWEFSETAVVEGQPLRVEQAGVARLGPATAPEARVSARVLSTSTSAAGPFVGARTETGQWVRLEATGSELLLTQGSRLLARAPLGGNGEELELSLWRRGMLLRGVARRGGEQGELEAVWAPAGTDPLRWECGSFGPRAEFLALRLDEAHAELPTAHARYAPLARRVDLLLTAGGVPRDQRDAVANEVLPPLLDLRSSLEPALRIDALTRAIYLACVRGSGDQAGELTALLTEEAGKQAEPALARLYDDQETGLDLVGQLDHFGPGFSGPTALRHEAGKRALKVLGGASPQELEAVARFVAVLTEVRAGKRLFEELEAALEAAPSAGYTERAEALLTLGRPADALRELDANNWRHHWFTASLRARALRRLTRLPESLETYLYSLARGPRPAVARSFFQQGSPLSMLLRQLKGSHPGSCATVLLTWNRLNKQPLADGVAQFTRLPTQDPRQLDLQAYVKIATGETTRLSRGDRPTQTLAFAAGGDPDAREALAQAAKADDLVYALVRLDPELRSLID